MPFNVKKCKLFHFYFPIFKHSSMPRAPIVREFVWNNLLKSAILLNVYKCLNSLVGLAALSTFARANQGVRHCHRS